MRRARDLGKVLCAIGSALALAGCGGGSDGNGGIGLSSGDGTVTAEWADFCTGVFTEDTAILDAFDEPAFTARAGAEYLLADFTDSFGGRAEFLYLTSVGPESFTLEPNEDGSWPFTSDCAIGEGVPYYGVFDDVSVFAEEELTTKICDLSAGTVLPAGNTARGYGLVGSSSDASIYEVMLGPFSEACEGEPRGYVRVPSVTLFGSTTWLVPIAGLIGPE